MTISRSAHTSHTSAYVVLAPVEERVPASVRNAPGFFDFEAWANEGVTYEDRESDNCAYAASFADTGF
jgi:hypothetical protein